MQPTEQNTGNAQRLLLAMAELAEWRLDVNVDPEAACLANELRFTKAQLDEFEDWLTAKGYLSAEDGSQAGVAFTQLGLDQAHWFMQKGTHNGVPPAPPGAREWLAACLRCGSTRRSGVAAPAGEVLRFLLSEAAMPPREAAELLDRATKPLPEYTVALTKPLPEYTVALINSSGREFAGASFPAANDDDAETEALSLGGYHGAYRVHIRRKSDGHCWAIELGPEGDTRS